MERHDRFESHVKKRYAAFFSSDSRCDVIPIFNQLSQSNNESGRRIGIFLITQEAEYVLCLLATSPSGLGRMKNMLNLNKTTVPKSVSRSLLSWWSDTGLTSIEFPPIV